MRLIILAFSLLACEEAEKKTQPPEKTQTEAKSAESKTDEAAKTSEASQPEKKSDAPAAEKPE